MEILATAGQQEEARGHRIDNGPSWIWFVIIALRLFDTERRACLADRVARMTLDRGKMREKVVANSGKIHIHPSQQEQANWVRKQKLRTALADGELGASSPETGSSGGKGPLEM